MTPAQLPRVLADRTAWTDDGCLLWLGGVTTKGYGRTTWQGREVGVHRLVAWAYYGPPPKGSESFACHACDVRNCVSPLHLRWATHRENMADARQRGRLRRGPQPFCRRGHPRLGPDADQYLTNYGQLACRACRRITARQRQAARRQGIG